MVASLECASLVYIRELKRQRRNKRKCLHKKRVQLPQDLFGTPTWPPFHCMAAVTSCENAPWRLRGNWGRVNKQTVKRVTNMIQFDTLIYLFMAIFSLEFSKQNVNLLVKRAACGSVR